MNYPKLFWGLKKIETFDPWLLISGHYPSKEILLFILEITFDDLFKIVPSVPGNELKVIKVNTIGNSDNEKIYQINYVY